MKDADCYYTDGNFLRSIQSHDGNFRDKIPVRNGKSTRLEFASRVPVVF